MTVACAVQSENNPQAFIGYIRGHFHDLVLGDLAMNQRNGWITSRTKFSPANETPATAEEPQHENPSLGGPCEPDATVGGRYKHIPLWTGPADFGDWIYRVATIRLEGGGAIQDCEVWWAEVEVRILTGEERARQEGRITALKSEMIRCGTAKLTKDIQGEARQVVADYVAGRVAEIIADQEGYRDPDKGFQTLVALTVLICTEEEQPSPYGGHFGSTWSVLMMLEEGAP